MSKLLLRGHPDKNYNDACLIAAVRKDDFNFGKKECYYEFIKNGGKPIDWRGLFFHVDVYPGVIEIWNTISMQLCPLFGGQIQTDWSYRPATQSFIDPRTGRETRQEYI